MERNLQSRNPQTCTPDLLSWSQIRNPDNSSAANRFHQPSDQIGTVLGGGQTTNEEAESLNKNVSYRKNCSGHKLKEMTGSDIFSDNGKNESNHKSRIHYHQDQQSQISFSGEENQTPKKPTSLTEEAKRKELSRSVQTKSDSKSKKKQIPNAKTKAISGHDIFESPPPTAIQPQRFLAATEEEVKGNKNIEETAPKSLRASAKASSGQTSKKIDNKKFQGLTSNGIFKSDTIPPGYSEKMHSSAKLREMSGHDIFADGKSEYRDYYGGVRRPPGGESSISLI